MTAFFRYYEMIRVQDDSWIDRGNVTDIGDKSLGHGMSENEKKLICHNIECRWNRWLMPEADGYSSWKILMSKKYNDAPPNTTINW